MEIPLAIYTLSLLSFVSPIKLECSFQIGANKVYTCTNLNLETQADSVTITEVTGNHLEGKSNADVGAVYLLSSLMLRLPQNMFELLPAVTQYALHGIDAEGHNLDALNSGDFRGAASLAIITVTGVNIEKLREKVFEGAENLDFLSLEACGLRSIDKNAFIDLSKLRSLSLNYNLLKYLQNETFSPLKNLQVLTVAGNYINYLETDHFANCPNLRKISFISNMLEVIPENITLSLTNIRKFSLQNNVCINANFGTKKNPIATVKEKIQRCTMKNVLRTKIKSLKQDVKDLLEEIMKNEKKITRLEYENEQLKDQVQDKKRMSDESSVDKHQQSEEDHESSTPPSIVTKMSPSVHSQSSMPLQLSDGEGTELSTSLKPDFMNQEPGEKSFSEEMSQMNDNLVTLKALIDEENKLQEIENNKNPREVLQKAHMQLSD